MPQPDYHIETFVSPPFDENSYVVHLPGRRDCLVIDPGFQPERIIDYLDRHGVAPDLILNTHGHGDHIAGNAALKQRWPQAPLVIGHGDAAMLNDPHTNLSGMVGVELRSPPPDRTVREGEEVVGAGMRLEVLEIPGHTPGHVVYVWREVDPPVVFGGDVLFAGSIGRSDFPGGNHEQLVIGIREKLFALPDATVVYSGHGGPTTVGEEKRWNPFVGEGTR